MDPYPAQYVTEMLPLYVLSGLDIEENTLHPLQEHGPRVGCATVQVSQPRARDIAQAFERIRALGGSLPEVAGTRDLQASFRLVKAQYNLPARKSSPQASPVDDQLDFSSPTSPSARTLHSPLSPLTFGSPIHPDGLMTPVWPAKYLQMIPSVLISFFEINSDPNTDSLRDNQLKNEIATIRNAIEDSKYRFRYAVVLIGNKSVVNGPELEERVINIRRAARLDEKYVFFLGWKADREEIYAFAVRAIEALQPLALEFYRDLTRHTRRKRDKGSNPSHKISRLGWLARYEYKLGILAEFCNEMEVAARHYNTSMMALFDSQGPVETTSSWSPRWNEARLWSDTTFIRLIRAQLACGAPTAAVRSWMRHRDRTRDLLQRKAKGTLNYGYLTWEARWSRIMADLTGLCPGLFHGHLSDDAEPAGKLSPFVFAKMEQNLAQEQQISPTLIPWQFLHHAGYWLRKSVAHTRRRLQLAFEISEEARIPPGQSPASAVARRTEAYETYLALEPHNEWAAAESKEGTQRLAIIEDLSRAVVDYVKHEQPRCADQIRLELSRDLMRAEQYAEAISVLKPSWESMRWRIEQWYSLTQQITAVLYHCAQSAHDRNLQVATLWELCSSAFSPVHGISYDVHACLQDVTIDRENSEIFRLDDVSTTSCLKITFSFGSGPAYVGVAFAGQLAVKYDAHEGCSPIALQSVRMEFDRGFTPFTIEHKQKSPSLTYPQNGIHFYDIDFSDLHTEQQTMIASSDLRFEVGQIKVFDIHLCPDEAGPCKATSLTTHIEQARALIEHVSLFSAARSRHEWRFSASDETERSPTARLVPLRTAVDIQPRPPRLTIDFVGLRNIYYTDELIRIALVVNNDEDEDADASVALKALSDSDMVPRIAWEEQSSERAIAESSSVLKASLGTLPPSGNHSRVIVLEPSMVSSDMVLDAKVSYTLPSSLGRVITKSANADVVIIRAFEATHQTLPDYHEAPWPNYFHLDDDPSEDVSGDQEDLSKSLSGMRSRWSSHVNVTSFAPDTLHIQSMTLSMSPLKGNANINLFDHNFPSEGLDLISNGQHATSFTLDVGKSSMDEQRPISTIPKLLIKWRRLDRPASELVNSVIDLPRLSLAGTEPRALARRIETEDLRTLAIEYVIENPSLHLLTFNVSIESSDDFAFSGPKSTTIQLTPLSRHHIKYVFMPFSKGALFRPDVRIQDVYFNKMLDIIPTGILRSKQGTLEAFVGDSP